MASFEITFTATVPVNDEGDEEETEVTVTGEYGAYQPAQIYGPAESCYPAEGGVEDISEATAVLEDGRKIELDQEWIDRHSDQIVDQVVEEYNP